MPSKQFILPLHNSLSITAVFVPVSTRRRANRYCTFQPGDLLVLETTKLVGRVQELCPLWLEAQLPLTIKQFKWLYSKCLAARRSRLSARCELYC